MTHFTIIDTPDDLQWLRDVHEAPAETQYAVLYGNEDAPDKIDCFFTADPRFDDQPDAVIQPWPTNLGDVYSYEHARMLNQGRVVCMNRLPYTTTGFDEL